MGIFTKDKAAPATASVDDGNDRSSDAIDTQSEVNALTADIKNDPAGAAALQLSELRLSPGAKSLLDRALDNLSQNDGAGIPDEDARAEIKLRAELVAACGNDFGAIIDALDTVSENPREKAAMVYSLGYNVLKSAVFYCNLDYRRYLDPKGDFDLWAQYGLPRSKGEDGNDPRDAGDRMDDRDEDTAPCGLDNARDRQEAWLKETYGLDANAPQWEWLKAIYGHSMQDEEEVFFSALSDLRLMLQLTAESFGWDPNNPMPFSNVMNKDGTFEPITDAESALNHSEIKRKESLAKRRAKQASTLSAAAIAGRAALKAALAR